MDSPTPRDAKTTPTRTVTCAEICADTIERMKRPDTAMKPADALTCLHLYSSMIALGKVTESTREEYDIWLKRFERYAAVVPHVRDDLDKACTALSAQIAENCEQLDRRAAARYEEWGAAAGRSSEARCAKICSSIEELKQSLDARDRAIWGRWKLPHVAAASVIVLLFFAAGFGLGANTWQYSTLQDRISRSVAAGVGRALDDAVLRFPPAADCTQVSAEASTKYSNSTLAAVTSATIPPTPPTTQAQVEADAYAPVFQLLLGTSTPYARACSPLTPKSTPEELGFLVEDLRNSVRYYLAASGAGKGDRRLSYLSAIHVDVPYCYCVVNTDYSRSIKYLNDEALVEMFNPRIVGYAHSRLVRSRERHHECERPAAYIRSETVWVRYEDPTGKQMERRFDGPLAYELQHIAELHSGEFRCHEELKEAIERAVEQSIVRNISPYTPNQLRWELPGTAEERDKRLLP